MAKVSEEARLEFNNAIQPYKDRITQTLEKEKTMLNAMHKGDEDLNIKKLTLCEDLIYVSSLYVVQNSLSMKLMDIKNNDALNEGRKILRDLPGRDPVSAGSYRHPTDHPVPGGGQFFGEAGE